MKQRIEIDIEGAEEGDLDLSLEEVVRLLKAGFTSGQNSNDTGRFSFTSTTTTDPPDERWIAHCPGDPMPVDPYTVVESRLRRGNEMKPAPAGELSWGAHFDLPGSDIVAWRRV
jgi:hypothetical protein